MGQIKQVLHEVADMYIEYMEDIENWQFYPTFEEFIKSINNPIHSGLTTEESRIFAQANKEVILDFVKDLTTNIPFHTGIFN